MEGDREHKGAEGKDIEEKDEPETSPISYLPIMVKHLIEDKSWAEKGNEGKPFKVQSLKDIGEGEKSEGKETHPKPPLLEGRGLGNLRLCCLL